MKDMGIFTICGYGDEQQRFEFSQPFDFNLSMERYLFGEEYKRLFPGASTTTTTTTTPFTTILILL